MKLYFQKRATKHFDIKISPDSLKTHILEHYERLDFSQNRMITKEDLIKAYKQSGFEVSENEIDQIIKHADFS